MKKSKEDTKKKKTELEQQYLTTSKQWNKKQSFAGYNSTLIDVDISHQASKNISF